MKKGDRSWALGLAITLALMVVLLALLPGAASTQGTPPVGQTEPPGAATQETVTSAGPLDDDPIDCDDPPSKRPIKLLGEDQIGLSWNNGAVGLWASWFKDTDAGLTKPLEGHWTSPVELSETIPWTTAWADLEGSGKDVQIAAFMDGLGRVSVARITNTGLAQPVWYCDEATCQGKNIVLIEVAAGNLDGHLTGDDDEEVVIAFRDSDKGLRVMVLDREHLGQPNQYAASWQSRGSNQIGGDDWDQISVSTGDLDGDGFDNEIVVGFHLYYEANMGATILRLDADGLHRKWYHEVTGDCGYAYGRDTYQFRGWLDLATGDVDGDFKDEAVLAFWDGCNTVQLDVFGHREDAQGNPVYYRKVYTNVNPAQGIDDDHVQQVQTPSVSVAVADLDGNGLEEIALAYSPWLFRGTARDFHGYHQLRTYHFVPPGPPYFKAKLQQVPDGHWGTSTPFSRYSAIGNDVFDQRLKLAVASSDLNGDGLAEVALLRTDPETEDLKLMTFNGKSGDKKGLFRRHETVVASSDGGRQSPFWFFDVATGDPLGLATYADYTGTCYETEVAYVTTVIHSPPYWPEVNAEYTQAGCGISVSHGGGQEQSTETKYGAEVQISAGLELKDVELGASFTYGFEKAQSDTYEVMTTTVDGVDYETEPKDEDWYALGYDLCARWCYEHKDSQDGAKLTVCLPRPACDKASGSLDWWYSNGRTDYPDSWVPVGMNVAKDKGAQQSSTAYGGVASRAVDGNTDGDFGKESVTFAQEGQYPWWQVDLGISPTIQAVQLWNRTDAVSERLSSFYVFLSAEEFGEQETPADIKGREGVWWYYHDKTVQEEYQGVPERLQTIPWHEFQDHEGQAAQRSSELTGRYVRVQLDGGYRNPLSLAEVQVWGVPSQVEQWPRFQPKPAEKGETFTLTFGDAGDQFKQVVNGKVAWAPYGRHARCSRGRQRRARL